MRSDGTGSELTLTPHPVWTTDILLVRHGQTDWNIEGRMQGRNPVELNDAGRAQVAATAAALAGLRPALVVSSPMIRAIQTAEIIGDAVGYAAGDISTSEGFAEFDMGDWVGRTFMELWAEGAIQSYWDDPTFTCFPGGESMPEIHRRAVEALNAIVTRGPGGTLVVATHGGIVRLLLLSALGLPRACYHRISADNASVSRIELVPGLPPRVHAINYRPSFRLKDTHLA